MKNNNKSLKILVAATVDASKSPRPNRMLSFLKDRHDVYYLGAGCINDSRVKFIQLPVLKGLLSRKLYKVVTLKLGFYRLYLRRKRERELLVKLKKHEFDIVICHDILLIPLISQFIRGEKVVLDVREYYPRQFEDKKSWRFLYKGLYDYLCRNFLSFPGHCVTVSNGLAREYLAEYGVEMGILLSLPPAVDLQPTIVEPERIELIYHGGINPSRKTEQLIAVMDQLDSRFHLDLMVVCTNEKYYNKIRFLVEMRRNIDIIPPVKLEEIIQTTNKYDMGLYYCPPSCFNVEFMMPNKLFEFVQARLAIAIGPSPDMRDFVESHGVGVVAEKFTTHSMAKALNALSASDISLLKQRSDDVARKFNASMNKRKVLKLIEEII